MRIKKDECYEQVKDLLTKQEFEERIRQRVEEFGNLLDEEALSLLIVDECGRNNENVCEIARLQANSECSVYGKITNIFASRTFNRKNGSSGNVVNLQVTDDSGTCGLALWDKDVELVKNGKIKIGTNLKIVNGYIKDGFNGIEINVGRYGFIHIDPENMPKITNKNNKMKGMQGFLQEVEPTRAFFKDDGEFGFVTNIKIRDKTQIFALSLWGEKAKEIQGFKKDDLLQIEGIDIREKNGKKEFHANGKATIKKL
ncbi:MAG: hypothetical protein U9O49_02605 [Candidatus Thermoplasmatota archaeon]|nr:hypothetical protein [Candidatus Thermoplasmatota archaeon]